MQRALNPAGGENFGWRLREGKIATGWRVGGPKPRRAVDPVFDYERRIGICVVGGYVYRGQKIPWLRGQYVFGDFIGKVFATRYDGTRASDFRDITPLLFPPGSGLDLQSLSGFGEDAESELYVVSLSGSVFKIVPAPAGIAADSSEE